MCTPATDERCAKTPKTPAELAALRVAYGHTCAWRCRIGASYYQTGSEGRCANA